MTRLHNLLHILSVACLWSTVCVTFSAVQVTAAGEGTNAEGLAFLETNQLDPNVHVLESGLQYKILTRGSGTHHPTIDSPCLCHYQGTLITGETFDSSYDRGSPTTFAPNQVIRGWTEAMQLMVEGDKWELVIPSELAYGDRGSPPKIPGGSVLVFVMEIIEIQGGKVEALKCSVEPPNEHCNDMELTYIEKMKSKDMATMNKELERLLTLQKGKMKPELKQWLSRRIFILQQWVKGNSKVEL